jgi:polysaccharide export outer membrane protein
MSSRVLRSLFLAGFLALAPASALAQQESPYALRPGDKVTVEVFTSAGEKVDVVAGERILDRNGDVYLPYVGTVHAAGLDQNSLREVLVAGYGSFYAEPVVNVKVLLRVNVTGAVPRAGQYFMDPTATIMDALSSAGGANTEYAVMGSQIAGNPRAIQLVRQGVRQVLNVHPAEITEETINMRVQSGDWLHVPPEGKTAIRDEILFWGSVLSLGSSVATLVVLLIRG